MTTMTDNPFQAVGIDHVVLRVTELDRSLDFYCRILGFELDRARDDIGLYHIRTGHSMIDLVPVDGELGRKGGAAPTSQGNNMDHFCLRIEPFVEDEILEHLREAGVAADAAVTRYGAEGDGPSIYIKDPDGNTVELKGPSV
jgi:catechol 2,3-dioxygenase-like lactoylglutathione lyase family enzyme